MKLKFETDIDLNSYYDSLPPGLRKQIQEAVTKLIGAGNQKLRPSKAKRTLRDEPPEGEWMLTKKRPTRVATKTYKLLMALERHTNQTYNGALIKNLLYEVCGGPPEGADTKLWITNLIKSGYLKEAK